MNRIKLILIASVAVIMLACNNTSNNNQRAMNETSQEPAKELVFPRGEKLDNPNFTGDAWLYNLVTADDENQNAVGSVTFAPGARTSWHSHPAGQIILAIDGIGYYQEKGKPVEIVRKGEVVKCPHNIPHWHGASPETGFIQVAITGRENGHTVWLEPVTDEEYLSYKE